MSRRVSLVAEWLSFVVLLSTMLVIDTVLTTDRAHDDWWSAVRTLAVSSVAMLLVIFARRAYQGGRPKGVDLE